MSFKGDEPGVFLFTRSCIDQDDLAAARALRGAGVVDDPMGVV